MGRVDAPADVQWARAFTAVIVGLVLACGMLCKTPDIPGVSAMSPELRAVVALPGLVTYVVRGVD